MSKEPVFAVLRFDPWVEDQEQTVSGVKVLPSQDQADAEVVRLNDLNREKGCRYVWQATRLYT